MDKKPRKTSKRGAAAGVTAARGAAAAAAAAESQSEKHREKALAAVSYSRTPARLLLSEENDKSVTGVRTTDSASFPRKALPSTLLLSDRQHTAHSIYHRFSGVYPISIQSEPISPHRIKYRACQPETEVLQTSLSRLDRLRQGRGQTAPPIFFRLILGPNW